MKKHLGCFIIAFLLTLVLTACGRDLSTPSSRLVGHWRVNLPVNYEWYFSEIDSKTGEGTLTEYNPIDDSVGVGQYKIFSEEPDGYTVTIVYKGPVDNGFDTMDVIVVQKDGMSATIINLLTMDYIDNKTKR
jgi:hypothetical protein